MKPGDEIKVHARRAVCPGVIVEMNADGSAKVQWDTENGRRQFNAAEALDPDSEVTQECPVLFEPVAAAPEGGG